MRVRSMREARGSMGFLRMRVPAGDGEGPPVFM